MRKVIFNQVIFLVLFLFVKISYAQDFSADFTLKSAEGIFTGKVYAKVDKVRMEIQKNIMISRMDKNEAWMLVPEEKIYMKIPLEPQAIISNSDKIAGEKSRRKILSENYDGKIVDKFEISYDLNGKSQKVLAWLSSDYNFPIKSAAVDGSWSIEYHNVVTSTYDNNLFEVPYGYQEFFPQVPPSYADK